MTIKEKIETIIMYMATNRQAGHSTLMRVGTDNFQRDKFILTKNLKQGDQYKCLRSEIVSLGSLGKLRGHDRPLAIDNHALVTIFDQAVSELTEQEEEIKTLKENINEITLVDIHRLKDDLRKEKIKFQLAIKDLKKERLEVKRMRNRPFKTFFKTIFGTWQP